MFKLALIVLFIGAAAASGFVPTPAVGNVIDGIDSLGLAYNNYDLNDGRVLGLGVGRFGYGFAGLGYGLGGLNYGLGGLNYGLGGLNYGLGGFGYGLGGLGLGR